MPFAYYERLSARDQAVYRRSDQVVSIVLPRPEALHPFVEVLKTALAQDARAAVAAAATRLGILEVSHGSVFQPSVCGGDEPRQPQRIMVIGARICK